MPQVSKNTDRWFDLSRAPHRTDNGVVKVEAKRTNAILGQRRYIARTDWHGGPVATVTEQALRAAGVGSLWLIPRNFGKVFRFGTYKVSIVREFPAMLSYQLVRVNSPNRVVNWFNWNYARLKLWLYGAKRRAILTAQLWSLTTIPLQDPREATASDLRPLVWARGFLGLDGRDENERRDGT